MQMVEDGHASERLADLIVKTQYRVPSSEFMGDLRREYHNLFFHTVNQDD